MMAPLEKKSHTPSSGLKKFFLYGMSIGFAALIILYALACLSIGSGVRSICHEATRAYPGDKVTALISYMNSGENSLQKRNRAIWVLGQLGNPRALPALEKFYTGKPCQHDKELCQHELKKAIRLCKGSLNITAWTWRRFIS